MALYEFTLKFFSSGDKPTDAFQNLLDKVQSEGLDINGEVEFSKLSDNSYPASLIKPIK
tara:strand:- start:3165 stop:3341 length:177 start_codon:yes stop_codon:yes gene_type:complete